MDGVLWRGETPITNLPSFFDTLRRQQISFMLATNNATKTAVMYAEKLARFGVDVAPEQILTSAEPPPLISGSSTRQTPSFMSWVKTGCTKP